ARCRLARYKSRRRAEDADHAAQRPRPVAPRSSARYRPPPLRATSSHSSRVLASYLRHSHFRLGSRMFLTAFGETEPMQSHGLSRNTVRRPALRGTNRSVAGAGFIVACTVAGNMLAGNAALGQTLDKLSFATNWVAEAEHGGFYQALADGTYRKYGLDITIVPGGPQVNNRILLPVGKIDFYLSANTLQSFDAVEQNIPTIAIASMFQKDPQVLIAHPDRGINDLKDLKNLVLYI